MSAAELNAVVVRLETVLARLEKAFHLPHETAVLTGKGTVENYVSKLEHLAAQLEAAVGLSAGISEAKGGAEPHAAMLIAYEEALEGPVATFVQLSRQIGGPVEAQGVLMGQLFVHHRRLVRLAPQSAKPGPKVLDMLFEATNECVSAIQVGMRPVLLKSNKTDPDTTSVW